MQILEVQELWKNLVFQAFNSLGAMLKHTQMIHPGFPFRHFRCGNTGDWWKLDPQKEREDGNVCIKPNENLMLGAGFKHLFIFFSQHNGGKGIIIPF